MLLGFEIVALVVIVAVSRHLMRKQAEFFEDRVRAQDEAEEGRRLALYKQQKEQQRITARSDKAVRQMSDQVRHLHEDARLLHQRVDRHFHDQNRG